MLHHAAVFSRSDSSRLLLAEWVHVGLIWTPLLSRFLLPASWEERLTVYLAFMPFLVTDVAWLVLPMWEWMTGCRSMIRRPATALYFLVCAILAACQVLVVGANVQQHLLTIIDAFVPLIVLSLYSYSAYGLRIHGYLLVAATIFLCLQVIGFSTQMLEWSSNITSEEFTMGAVARTRSTVGAATATGVVILMLGVLGCELSRWRRSIRYAVYALMTVGVTSTMSRGAILALLGVLGPLVRQLSVRRSAALVRGLVLGTLVAGLVGAVVVWTHLGNALLERIDNIAQSGDLTTGRMDRVMDAVQVFETSPFIGHGFGTTFGPASLGREGAILISVADVISPHNAYLALLADVGILGSLLYWTPLLLMLVRTAAQRRTSLTWYCMISVFLICMNTETVFLTFEFIGLIYLCLLSLLCQNPGPARQDTHGIPQRAALRLPRRHVLRRAAAPCQRGNTHE